MNYWSICGSNPLVITHWGSLAVIDHDWSGQSPLGKGVGELGALKRGVEGWAYRV